MKKILLLGTSLASVEIVQTAKDMGCYTIVTDNLPPELSNAKYEADEYWMISTDDIDQLEKNVRKKELMLSLQESVNLILIESKN